MTPEEQSECFCEELDVLVNRYVEEFDLPYIDVVGALEMKKHEICAMAKEESTDDDDDDDGGEYATVR